MNKITKKKLNAKNSKILHETMVTLGALKEGSDALNEMEINEIQVHLLDDSGDGVILCLEYDESTGELSKTFSTVEEYYEEGGTDDGDRDTPHYYGDHEDVLDSCYSPENAQSKRDYYEKHQHRNKLQTMVEETISEEYDEIFHNSSSDDDDPPPLLN